MQQAIYSDNQSFTDFIPFLGRLTVYNLSMFSLVKSCDQILSFVVLNCITCIFPGIITHLAQQACILVADH
jgi:hypothetical protein